jgi:uncharacterized protein YceK
MLSNIVKDSSAGLEKIFMREGQKMKKTFILLVVGLLLCGCASTAGQCLQRDIKKSYAPATEALKNNLSQDLASGKVAIGATIDSVRSSYGQPDDMLVSGCTARLIYRLDSGKNVTLWFDDGWQLSMWSN